MNSDRAEHYLLRDAIRALGKQCKAVVDSNAGVSAGVKVEPIPGAPPVALRALSALVNACDVVGRAREVLGNAVVVSFLFQISALKSKKQIKADQGAGSDDQWELWKFNYMEFADATSNLQAYVHGLESFAALEEIETALQVQSLLNALILTIE